LKFNSLGQCNAILPPVLLQETIDFLDALNNLCI